MVLPLLVSVCSGARAVPLRFVWQVADRVDYERACGCLRLSRKGQAPSVADSATFESLLRSCSASPRKGIQVHDEIREIRECARRQEVVHEWQRGLQTAGQGLVVGRTD